MNEAELDANVLDMVTRSRADKHACSLCCRDVKSSADLLRVCGRKGCSQRACKECLEAWYGALEPGAVVVESNLLCPFCKKRPNAKILVKNNARMSALKVDDAALDYDRFVNAWCLGCYHIRPAFPKICADPARVLEAFLCESCVEKRHGGGNPADIRAKPCPTCEVMTEKSSGCNHMECLNCASHWCFECGMLSSYDEIYVHMSRAHGGYGIEHDDSEDDES